MLDRPVPLDTGLDGVVLRRLSRADAAAFAAHVTGDLEHLGAFLAWPEVTADEPGAAAWLGPYERQEGGRVVVGGLWGGDRLLGGALLSRHEPVNRNIELGIWVVTGVEGHGVAAEACRVLLRLAREELRVERVVWHCAPANVRSRRLAERLGFAFEGTSRSDYVVRGVRLDTDVLSLVGHEIDAAIA